MSHWLNKHLLYPIYVEELSEEDREFLEKIYWPAEKLKRDIENQLWESTKPL